MAVGFAVLLGLVGLGIDVGNLVYNRTDLQKMADAAALAGAQELAKATPSTTTATSTAKSYVDLNTGGGVNTGAVSTTVAFFSAKRANDTIQVTVERNVGSTFGRFVGWDGGTVSATAKVQVQAVTGLKMDSVDVFPYAVWGGTRTAGNNNSCPYNICIGSTQVYRSNQWDSDSKVSTGYNVNGNNFKGYFHQGTGIVNLDPNGWQTFSNGGNATGQQPTAALDAHVASGKPVIIPVITAATCTGGCGTIQFKIVAWVALKLNPRGNPSQPWTGTVVDWSVPDGETGGNEPPTGFPAVYIARFVS
jgi:Flp pilus assembly protein TadG